MKSTHLKHIAVAIALIAGPAVSLAMSAANALEQNVPYTTAAEYYTKAKCSTCHGKKAEKKFDTAKTDEENVDIIMKGKKAEKPPHMPGYGARGVTTDQAKELLAYMKTLRPQTP